MKLIKRLGLTFAVLIGLSLGISAQDGLSGGAHYSYNSTWLMNAQVFDHGDPMNTEASYGSYWGLNIAYEITDAFSLATELNFNTMNQKYLGDIDYFGNDEVNSYTSQTSLKTIDIPILLQFGEDFYFEIGPVFQFVSNANFSVEFDESFDTRPGVYKEAPFSMESIDNADVKDAFSNGTAIAIGFGSDVELTENIFINIGFRAQYTITDMEGINGLGFTIDDPYVPENEKDRFETNPLIGGIKLGLKYKL